MSRHTSEAVAREFLARVNRGDRDGAMELVSDSPCWHSRRGSRRGRDVALEFITRHGPQDHIVRELIVERAIEHDDHLVLLLDVQTRWTDEGLDSTVADHSHVGAIIEVREGRIAEWISYPEQAEALSAAGII